jgi:hypothetical protein
MRILKGKTTGDGYKLHQWANDWITCDGPDGRQNVIAKPLNVQLEGDEYWRMRESYVAWWQRGDRSCGLFWVHWKLELDGTFTRREPKP